MRARVAIIGAGPAGLLLAHLLRQSGIDAIVLEKHTRKYVEGRVRAGVLEEVTVNLMTRLGLDARLRKEGLVHSGTSLAVNGEVFHVDFADLTGGSTITIYGQSEIMKDLGSAAGERGLNIVYGAENVALHGLDTDQPVVTWREHGVERRLACEYVVGCDGYHGVSRRSIPSSATREFERAYPFGWLGILANAPPCSDELIYANHERGFALASMRSPTCSRCYIQCALSDDIENWPDDRFWNEFCERLGPAAAANVTRAPSLEKSIAPLRSFVVEPMRWKRLFLAGDAAHIVPPTGAKGLNLAASDVIYLSDALIRFYETGAADLLDSYSDRALARVWKAERFSWWFTGLTHRFPDADPLDRKLQIAELDYMRSSRAAQTTLAENYVGLPL